jgi:hypothetical protein
VRAVNGPVPLIEKGSAANFNLTSLTDIMACY